MHKVWRKVAEKAPLCLVGAVTLGHGEWWNQRKENIARKKRVCKSKELYNQISRFCGNTSVSRWYEAASIAKDNPLLISLSLFLGHACKRSWSRAYLDWPKHRGSDKIETLLEQIMILNWIFPQFSEKHISFLGSLDWLPSISALVPVYGSDQTFWGHPKLWQLKWDMTKCWRFWGFLFSEKPLPLCKSDLEARPVKSSDCLVHFGVVWQDFCFWKTNLPNAAAFCFERSPYTLSAFDPRVGAVRARWGHSFSLPVSELFWGNFTKVSQSDRMELWPAVHLPQYFSLVNLVVQT